MMCGDVTVIIAGIYLYVSMGIKGENIDLLLRLKALSDDGRRCVIAPGDYNVTAEEMEGDPPSSRHGPGQAKQH